MEAGLPFKITWTGPTGAESIKVATAADALREIDARRWSAINLTVTDDRRRKVTEGQLAVLARFAEGQNNA